MEPNHGKKYLVDGKLLTEEEVRRIFKNGIIEQGLIADRDRIALKMLRSVVATGRYLDVGCYAGMFVKLVNDAHPGLEACGVDYYDDHIAIARLLYPELADRFRQMNVYALDFECGYFDCVTFKEVIEHLDRPVDAIREINRVLRLGGHLIVSTPNANASPLRALASEVRRRLWGAYRGRSSLGHLVFFENVEWNRHLFSWTPLTLNTLLVKNGFEYIDHRFYASRMIERLLPGLETGFVFLVRKMAQAPTQIV